MKRLKLNKNHAKKGISKRIYTMHTERKKCTKDFKCCSILSGHIASTIESLRIEKQFPWRTQKTHPINGKSGREMFDTVQV